MEVDSTFILAVTLFCRLNKEKQKLATFHVSGKNEHALGSKTELLVFTKPYIIAFMND